MRSNPSFRRFLGLARLGAVATFLPLLSGCLLDLNGPQSTFDPAGPVARRQLDLFYLTCWVTLVIFLIVGTVLAIAQIKFRAKNEEEAKKYVVEQGHGNPLVEIGLIGASVLALVVIAFPTLSAIYYTFDVPESEKANAYEVTATGYQWWFKFDYPKEKADSLDPTGKIVSAPFSVANELVIPAHRAVRINLRSVDVIHSFWIPKLGGKVDMMPNRANHLWVEADKPGYYWGQCAEFCGESHAVMRFRVIALSQADFATWVDSQSKVARKLPNPETAAAAPKAQFAAYRTFKQNEEGTTDAFDADPFGAWKQQQQAPAGENAALVARGRELFASKTCSSCHTIRGDGYVGVVGPELTHVGARSTIAAGLLENNRDELHRWIHAPNVVKPGNTMWVKGYVANHIQLTPDDEDALVNYLESLK